MTVQQMIGAAALVQAMRRDGPGTAGGEERARGFDLRRATPVEGKEPPGTLVAHQVATP